MAKRKTPDYEEARALLSKAQDRILYVKSREVTNRTAKFVLEDAYESVREAAQSLMSVKGFKPYSHEATIGFMIDFYKKDFEPTELSKFDYFRRLRNNSVYKAIVIEEHDANTSILFAEKFIEKVKQLLKKEINF